MKVDFLILIFQQEFYAEIRNLSNLRFQTQEEITKIKNRTARWFSIYFPEYKDVYGNLDAVSGMMILKEAPLPDDIVRLGAEGINRIWREAKLRAVGMKRAKTLVNKAEHSVGSHEAPVSLIGKNPEFKEIHNYYLTRERNPLKKMQSVITIACKVIRVFYMMLTKGAFIETGQ